MQKPSKLRIMKNNMSINLLGIDISAKPGILQEADLFGEGERQYEKCRAYHHGKVAA